MPSLRHARSITGVFARAVALGALLLGPGQGASLSQIQSGGVFRLAFSTPHPPLIAQEDGAFNGFAVELISLLARQMQVRTVTWQRVGTPELLVQGLQNKAYDAVIDTRLPQPLGGVNLTKPIACGGGVILARPGGPTQEQDLKGKRIAVVTGSSYFYYVRNLPFDKKISAFSDDAQALISFLAGAVDVLVTDRYAALKMYKQAGDKRVQVSPLLWSQDIDIVVTNSDDKEILSALNAGLKKLQKDGTYAKLSQKHFGQDVSCVL
ncbi:ABC transporter substrate-binding protein [Deinococcus sonorensis]|uniref:ABC transporter substrate-binding protein n=2 Tax=Deinococcus sonorensis TaxID=309891 RepID=A0AAU7U8R7_9DEIO